ncbi:MAG: glycosyltransferase [Pseudomonadota bacterium]
MSLKRKVFVLPSWYPPDGGSFFKEQTEALSEIANLVVVYPRGVSIRALIKSPLKEINNLYRTKEIDAAVPTLIFSYLSLPKLFRINLLSKWLCFRVLFSAASKKYGEPELIHVHSGIWAGYCAYRLKKKRSIPYIITEHRGRFVDNYHARMENQLPKQYRKFLTKIFSNASYIAPVSRSMIPKITSYLERDVTIEEKPNLVNAEIFDAHKGKVAKSEKFTFVTVCALVKLKGVDILINAFAEVLTEAHSDVELLIIGDGPERRPLENMVERLGICEAVKFKGQQPREKVGQLMLQSHVFVLPTRYEAFGVVFGEALMAGLPVLATRRSGGPDSIVIPGINGYLFDIDDADQLRELMVNAYSNYDAWDHDKIEKNAKKKYGRKAFLKKYQSLFDEVFMDNN